jgi:hypothetical protein
MFPRLPLAVTVRHTIREHVPPPEKNVRHLPAAFSDWNSPGKVDMKYKQIQIHFENGGNEHYVKY